MKACSFLNQVKNPAKFAKLFHTQIIPNSLDFEDNSGENGYYQIKHVRKFLKMLLEKPSLPQDFKPHEIQEIIDDLKTLKSKYIVVPHHPT